MKEAPKAHTGFFGLSGIQQHSVGDIYPYHVVMQGNDKLYAMHADGTCLTTFHYGEGHAFTFKEAHAEAEREAIEALTASGERPDLYPPKQAA